MNSNLSNPKVLLTFGPQCIVGPCSCSKSPCELRSNQIVHYTQRTSILKRDRWLAHLDGGAGTSSHIRMCMVALICLFWLHSILTIKCMILAFFSRCHSFLFTWIIIPCCAVPMLTLHFLQNISVKGQRSHRGTMGDRAIGNKMDRQRRVVTALYHRACGGCIYIATT